MGSLGGIQILSRTSFVKDPHSSVGSAPSWAEGPQG